MTNNVKSIGVQIHLLSVPLSFTLMDLKIVGQLSTARMPMCRIRSLGSSLNLAILLTYILLLNGLVSVCQAEDEPETGETPASTLLGICNLPDPCIIGERYGDPGNCTVYYECSSPSNVLDLHTCESGSKYDYKKKKCRMERPNLKRPIRCTPPCEEEKNNKRKQEDENKEPKVEAKTETPTQEGKPNVTSKQMESITESNKPLTTTTERNDTGVKVAGNLVPDNDTINAAMVDPNLPYLPADGANTTAGETVEETEAQTDKDVITTASSSTASTSPPTVPSTTKPTIKPTTKPTTKSTTTTQPGIIVVETDGDPGYDIVTSSPSNSSGSVGNADESKKVSSATIGIAVGIIVALLIVSVAVVLLICRIRKKKTSKEKQIVSIENPKYKKSGGDKHAYRFSRDGSLLVNEKPPNNNGSTEKLAFIPGRKRPAPSTPSKDKNKEKRKAPPPPNPFTGEVDNDENYRPPTFRKDSSDLYERDTDGSTEDVELSTFSAPTSSFGTGTGTFGKPRTLVDPRKKETPNGQLQQSRSTDYSSDEDDSEEEDDKLLSRKYQSGDTDDAVFKDDVTAKDVNNSMDAYLSAYDQALK